MGDPRFSITHIHPDDEEAINDFCKSLVTRYHLVVELHDERDEDGNAQISMYGDEDNWVAAVKELDS